MSLLIAYTPSPPDDEMQQQLVQIRRHIVLACVLMHKHAHGEKSFDRELAWVVITQDEVDLLSKQTTSIARVSRKKVPRIQLERMRGGSSGGRAGGRGAGSGWSADDR